MASRFVFASTKTADFGRSGFWDCTVERQLTDVIFRGRYAYELQQQKNVTPVMTGLHNVDFRNAHLKFILAQTGCAMDGIRLPSSNTTLLCRCSDLLKTAGETSKRLTEHERSAFSLVSKLVALHAKGQDIGFLCKGDLMSLCDEDSAQTLFQYLKERYQLGTPYAIA